MSLFSIWIGLSQIFSTFFFFNDTATTEIYTLSLHDALPILVSSPGQRRRSGMRCERQASCADQSPSPGSFFSSDRKSTRLNSSHLVISYAVFCLKKKRIQRRVRH